MDGKDTTVTDPNEPGHAPGAGSGPTWTGGFPGAAGGSSGFPVPAQPPIDGYPAPGSGGVRPPTGTPGYPPAGYPDPAYPGMSGPADPHAAPGYAAAGYPAPGYQSTGYPGPAYAAQPGSALPYGPYAPTGYASPGWVAAGYARPGTITGSAVLAFVTAGFDILGAIMMTALLNADTIFGRESTEALLWIAIFVSFVCGGLLIAGGVTLLRGQAPMLYVGAGGTIAVAVYWLVMAFRPGTGLRTGVDGFQVYPLTYLALAVIMVALASSPGSRAWCASRAAVGRGR